MGRPSYLGRHPDGRYYLQIRLGKRAAEIYGRPLLRVTLKTSNFKEARRRLVEELDWALEIVDAPDLESLGAIFDRRLRAYVAAGVPGDERELSGRQAFEHQVGIFFVRARERGFFYGAYFPELATNWGRFVDENKAAEDEIAKCSVHRLNSSGSDLALTDGTDKSGDFAVLPSSPGLAPFDPAAFVQGVTQGLAQGLAQGVATEFAKYFGSAAVGPTEVRPSADLKNVRVECPTSVASAKKMSDVLAEFLRPADRKRQHKMKGRGEAEAVVQFAIDFLGDPRMNELTEHKWELLDEALPDIPNRDNIPAQYSKTLFQRYKYAETKGWSDLARVSIKSVKSRYWGGLYKFIDWAIQEKHYLGPRPKFECIDPDNLVSLPRDAFNDDELLTLLMQPLFTGCKNRTHVWQSGEYFVQSHIYWGFLICILTVQAKWGSSSAQTSARTVSSTISTSDRSTRARDVSR